MKTRTIYHYRRIAVREGFEKHPIWRKGASVYSKTPPTARLVKSTDGKLHLMRSLELVGEFEEVCNV